MRTQDAGYLRTRAQAEARVRAHACFPLRCKHGIRSCVCAEEPEHGLCRFASLIAMQ